MPGESESGPSVGGSAPPATDGPPRVANMQTEYHGDGPSGYGRSSSDEANVPASYRAPDARWDTLQASGELARLQAGLGPPPVTLAVCYGACGASR